jgi:hypothetical protein
MTYRDYSDMKINCPYKIFDWSQTYLDSSSNFDEGRDQTFEKCTTEEEANCLRKYNNLVDEYVENEREMKLLNLFKDNFNDNETYELTARQMISLGF